MDPESPPRVLDEPDRHVHFEGITPPSMAQLPTSPVTIPVLNRIRESPELVPTPAPSPKGKARATEDDYQLWEASTSMDTSDDTQVRGMEKKLDAARVQHERRYQNIEREKSPALEHERDQDKRRIMDLETEIRSLKAEVGGYVECTLTSVKCSIAGKTPSLWFCCSPAASATTPSPATNCAHWQPFH